MATQPDPRWDPSSQHPDQTTQTHAGARLLHHHLLREVRHVLCVRVRVRVCVCVCVCVIDGFSVNIFNKVEHHFTLLISF